MKRAEAAAGFVIGASLLLLAKEAPAQSGPQPLAAQEIMRRVVERAKWAREQDYLGQFGSTQHSVREKLGDRGSVKEREEKVYEVFPIDGVPFRKLVERNGSRLSLDQLKREQEREQEFRRTLPERKRRKAPGENQVVLNDELVGKYRFELLGREQINGRPAFLLAFKPRGRGLPVRRRVDRILNRLAGKVCIDEEEYEIVKLEISLAEKATMWGGVLASVRTLDIRLEQSRVDEGVWFPSRIEGYLDGRYFFSSLRLRQSERWTDFRKVTPELGDRRTGSKDSAGRDLASD